MLLIIDTSSDSLFRVGIARLDGSAVQSSVVKERRVQSERLLPEISTILKAGHLSLRKVRGIVVAVGPGGFTSLRIGVSTANALSYALHVPIAGVLNAADASFEQLCAHGASQLHAEQSYAPVQPQYGQPPNITTPRKHVF